MKKIVYTAAVFCMLAALVSCKSTKAEKKSSKKKSKTEVTAEAPAETQVTEAEQTVL